jgi:hypothetical protein
MAQQVTSREGIEIFGGGVTNDMIDHAIAKIAVDYFLDKKHTIDKRQQQVIDNSIFSQMSASEREEASKVFVAEMPLWEYIEIMRGTKDKDFWNDESNKRKLFQECPQYLTKNFKKR